MANTQNSIVLNGKLYDAVTGEIIHDQAAIAPPQPKPKIHRKQRGLAMDGVVIHHTKHHSHMPHKAHNAEPPKPVHHRPVTERASVHARRHKPERAATLMRRAVHKPAYRPTPQAAERTSVHDQRTAERLARAKAVKKSHHIQRFPHHAAHNGPKPIPKKHAEVPVEAAPTHPPAAQAHPHLSLSEQLVTNALKNAHSHEANQPFAKKRRRMPVTGWQRTGRLAAASLAVLVLIGFFVYQNVPSLSMRLAASRAGVDAQLPGYAPAGFSQDKLVSYSPGKVTINFHSNTDSREFKLVQQVSNWNSQALADNFLAAKSKQYQTYQASGKTIYIFDGSNATWVNGGVWYQIEGHSSLSSDQILKIANSI